MLTQANAEDGAERHQSSSLARTCYFPQTYPCIPPPSAAPIDVAAAHRPPRGRRKPRHRLTEPLAHAEIALQRQLPRTP